MLQWQVPEAEPAPARRVREQRTRSAMLRKLGGVAYEISLTVPAFITGSAECMRNRVEFRVTALAKIFFGRSASFCDPVFLPFPHAIRVERRTIMVNQQII